MRVCAEQCRTRMDDLELNPKIISAVKRAPQPVIFQGKLSIINNIFIKPSKLASFAAVLNLSPADLGRCTKLSAHDIQTLLQTVSREVYKNPSATALEVYQGTCDKSLQVATVSTGCAVLDEFLNGGILTRGITEIAGESAAGKTQLCMQLCLSVQRSVKNGGLGGGAVYVCTEDVFPSKRLHQLIQTFQKRLDATETNSLRLGDNIFIEHVSERDQLSHCIKYRIPLLLQQSQVKLIILDSLAALFRCEFSSEEAVKRAQHLQTLGAKLHHLGRIYGIPVVCVNQVTANMTPSSVNDNKANQRQLIPALGLTWSNLIQTRLMLGRTDYQLMPDTNQHPEDRMETLRDVGDPEGLRSVTEVPVRTLEVVFAPHLPRDTCYYVVEADGVRGLR